MDRKYFLKKLKYTLYINTGKYVLKFTFSVYNKREYIKFLNINFKIKTGLKKTIHFLG